MTERSNSERACRITALLAISAATGRQPLEPRFHVCNKPSFRRVPIRRHTLFVSSPLIKPAESEKFLKFRHLQMFSQIDVLGTPLALVISRGKELRLIS
jgi:hypothetical protein